MSSSAPVQAVKKYAPSVATMVGLDAVLPGAGTVNAAAEATLPKVPDSADAPMADMPAEPANKNAPTLDQEIGKSAAAASIARSGNMQDVAGDNVLGKRRSGAAARALGQV